MVLYRSGLRRESAPVAAKSGLESNPTPRGFWDRRLIQTRVAPQDSAALFKTVFELDRGDEQRWFECPAVIETRYVAIEGIVPIRERHVDWGLRVPGM